MQEGQKRGASSCRKIRIATVRENSVIWGALREIAAAHAGACDNLVFEVMPDIEGLAIDIFVELSPSATMRTNGHGGETGR
jgi:hypothetical protein